MCGRTRVEVEAVRIVDSAIRLGWDNLGGLFGGERQRADREVIVRRVKRRDEADFIVVDFLVTLRSL